MPSPEGWLGIWDPLRSSQPSRGMPCCWTCAAVSHESQGILPLLQVRTLWVPQLAVCALPTGFKHLLRRRRRRQIQRRRPTAHDSARMHTTPTGHTPWTPAAPCLAVCCWLASCVHAAPTAGNVGSILKLGVAYIHAVAAAQQRKASWDADGLVEQPEAASPGKDQKQGKQRAA
jgi:hypothetical protein